MEEAEEARVAEVGPPALLVELGQCANEVRHREALDAMEVGEAARELVSLDHVLSSWSEADVGRDLRVVR
jgi:hypothetical protein